MNSFADIGHSEMLFFVLLIVFTVSMTEHQKNDFPPTKEQVLVGAAALALLYTSPTETFFSFACKIVLQFRAEKQMRT